jgi:hypothetical protein
MGSQQQAVSSQPKNHHLCALAILLLIADFSHASTQAMEVYRTKHRKAHELVPFAKTALGSEGQVTLDVRTATLVLSGRPSAIRRALALLEEMDRPLRQLVLTQEIRELQEMDALSARIAWKVSYGSFQIGTLPLSADGIHVALGARRESRQSTTRNVLRLLEGGTGHILTGKAVPFIYELYWGNVTLVPAETGFEVTATMLGDGRAHLELRPFSGRLDGSQGLRYLAAATTIDVTPGETVVFAEVPHEADETTASLSGGGKARVSEQQVLLIAVEVENP